MGYLLNFLFCCVLLSSSTLALAQEIPEIRIPLHSTSVNFNPATVQDISSLWVSRQVTCQLLTLNASLIQLEAADSIRYRDPTHIDIHLRSNLFFSDGEALTAEDVIASYSYLRSNRQEFKNLYNWISQMTIISNKEIEIVLKVPIPQFLKILAAPHSPIYEAAFLKAAQTNPHLWNEPISCGDYKVVQNNPNGVKLAPVSKGLPINFIFNVKNELTTQQLDQFDIDGLSIVGNPSQVDGYHVLQIFNPYEIYLGLNTHKKPWNDRANRCALLSRLKPSTVENKYGQFAQPATDLLPSGVLGYNDSQAYSQSILQPFTSYPLPSVRKLCVSFLDVSIPHAKQDDFIGLLKEFYPDIQIQNIADVSHFGSDFLKSDCDVYIAGFEASTFDGYGILDMYTKSPENFTGFDESAVSQELEASQSSIDPSQRYHQYRQIVRQIQDACVTLPILLLPYQYIYIKDTILAPDMGLVRLENYRLVNVRFKGEANS